MFYVNQRASRAFSRVWPYLPGRAETGGKIPSGYDELLEMPGIGQYMEGAILSIVFNKPYPVVDGNVRRCSLVCMAGSMDPR